MRNLIVRASLSLAALSAFAAANAATLVLDFSAANYITGDLTAVNGLSGMIARLTLTDVSGGVQATLQNLSLGSSTQFLTELNLNVNPYVAGAGTDFNSFVNSVDFSSNGHNGEGGAKFDVQVLHKTANADRLKAGQTSSWKFTGTGLDALDFKALDSKGNHYAMLHVQGLGTNGNGSVKLYGVEAVPEPASMAALGLGAIGLLRRRRKA